jgi:hypothetical protein
MLQIFVGLCNALYITTLMFEVLHFYVHGTTFSVDQTVTKNLQ